jgi:phosphohistidine phosphatase
LGQTISKLLGLSENECAVKKGALWWLRYRERDGIGQTVVVTVQSPEVL